MATLALRRAVHLQKCTDLGLPLDYHEANDVASFSTGCSEHTIRGALMLMSEEAKETSERQEDLLNDIKKVDKAVI